MSEIFMKANLAFAPLKREKAPPDLAQSPDVHAKQIATANVLLIESSSRLLATQAPNYQSAPQEVAGLVDAAFPIYKVAGRRLIG